MCKEVQFFVSKGRDPCQTVCFSVNIDNLYSENTSFPDAGGSFCGTNKGFMG
jgi:hypothetical protein